MFVSNLITFIIYMTVILSSTFFVYCAERHLNNKHIARYLFYSFLALFISSMLAGIRGDTVGVDVKTYTIPWFNMAKSYNNFIPFYIATGTDIGFAFVIFFTTKIFDSIIAVHFLIALIQALPIYIVAYLYRDRQHMYNTMFVYYCLFYLMGFNIMRQCIAASFILLAFCLLNEKNLKQFTLCIFLAFIFHKSAVIGIGFILVSFGMTKIKSKLFRLFTILVSVIVICLVMANWYNILSEAINIGVISDKFEPYLDVFSGRRSDKSYVFEVGRLTYLECLYKYICFFVPLFFIFFYKRSLNRLQKGGLYATFTALLVYVVFFVILNSGYGYRISTYGEYFLIIFLPAAYRYDTKHQLHKVYLSNLLCTLMLTSYVLIVYAWQGSHGVTPFSFIF